MNQKFLSRSLIMWSTLLGFIAIISFFYEKDTLLFVAIISLLHLLFWKWFITNQGLGVSWICGIILIWVSYGEGHTFTGGFAFVPDEILYTNVIPFVVFMLLLIYSIFLFPKFKKQIK